MTAVAARPAAPVAPPPTRREPIGLVSNAAVAGLTLAAVFGLARLFTQPARFFAPVAAVTLTVHAVCWACRRRGLGLPVAAAAVAVVTALLTSWLLFLHTTTFGIPDAGTAHAASDALSAASALYRSVAAPAPVAPGFTLAASIGAALAAFLADWAAFRMRATIEACLPSFSLFVLSAALAQGRGEVEAGMVWLAAVLVFLLVRHSAVDSAPSAWFASRGATGARAVLLTGAVLGAGAVALAAVFGPQLPGATIHPLFDWRHRNTGDSSRTIGVSPLVDITARLQSQSHQEVFTVKASRPTYWRLTSLDHFTGTGWSLKNEFVAGSRLAAPAFPSTSLVAEFQIKSLSSIWLPAPYRPIRVTGIGGTSVSDESGSVITNKATSDALTYTVQSAVPSVDPGDLVSAPPIDPADPTLARYLQLPALSPAVRQLAVAATRSATSPYAQAKALQDWLRSPPFRYDLNVKADDAPNALLNFLTVTRAGFCQQFAASYAVLARSIGLPTRVAVGFSEGTVGADGLYHVSDAQAHAWPEVYFQDIGWIAFEPTPGRGSPDPVEQAVTGVPPAQDTAAGTASGSTPTVTVPVASASGPATTTVARQRTPSAGDGSPLPVVRHRRPWWHHPALVGFALVLLALAIWATVLNATTMLVRRRRTARAREPDAVVNLAWIEATEALADAGVPPFASETPAEYAARAANTLPTAPGVALGDLARAVEVADYAPSGATAATAAATTGAVERIRAALRADRGWPAWLRRVVDPRPAARLVVSELSHRR